MRISEIFYSIQGEGELSGTPSVFIRTSGCNLRCAWCDTPYTYWHPEGERIPLESILAEVIKHPTRHVVLTGGEPMVARELPALAKALRREGRHITIETAGTLPPQDITCDFASLSPKLANSTPDSFSHPEWGPRHEKRRLRPHVIAQWVTRYPFQLKFVISTRSEIEDIQSLLKSIPVFIPPEKILLMPEGTDTATLHSRANWLVEEALRHGFRYCPRLHIELFGHRRGV